MENLNLNVINIRTVISNSHTKTNKYTNNKIIFFCTQSAITPTFFEMSSNSSRKIIKEYIQTCNLCSFITATKMSRCITIQYYTVLTVGSPIVPPASEYCASTVLSLPTEIISKSFSGASASSIIFTQTLRQ